MDKIDLPEKDPERWAHIKFHLELKGYSFASLAREIGVSRSSMTSTKKTWLFKNQKAIAEKIGAKPEEIWPERYADDKNPKNHSSRYPRCKSTIRKDKRQRQSLGAPHS